MTYTLTILGPPRTKKNSGRIFRNRATGCPMFMPSASSKKWESSAAFQIMSQWRRSALTEPVQVIATFYRERAVGDLVNFMQALADALEVAKVVVDDKQIVSWDGTRMDKDAKHPRVEVTIAEVA